MRIITGSAKGLKLKTPKGLDVRPTADRVKESVFNIIAGLIPEARVADFFSGTGNLGLEALSRGAAIAVFVDSSFTSMNLLKENTARARLADRAVYLKSDAVSAIMKLSKEKQLFNVIFCDPPYNRGYVAAMLSGLDKSGLLYPGGCIVFEHSKHESIPSGLKNLQVSRSERYGETLVTFLTDKRQQEDGIDANSSMPGQF